MPSSDPPAAASRRQSGYPGPLITTAAAYGWRWLVLAAVIVGVLYLLSQVFVTLIAAVAALLVAALLRPCVVFLSRYVPRTLATFIILIGGMLIIGSLLTAVVIRAVAEVPAVGDQVNRAVPSVEHWLVHGPLRLNQRTINNFGNTVVRYVREHSSAVAATAASTGRVILRVLVGAIIALLVTIFLLYDGDRIGDFLIRAAPQPVQARVRLAGEAAWRALVHYIRGTMVVAVFHAGVTALTLWLLGVPLVLPIAFLVGVGSFIPLFGPVIFGAVTVAAAGVTQGLTAAVIVLAVIIADSQVDAHLLQPFVVGRYVRLHPLAVVLALAIGDELFGIVGAIVAVPLIGSINAAVGAARRAPTGTLTGAVEAVQEAGPEERPAATKSGQGSGA